ncbi:IclR family transcriptional regulator [Deinococcus peraridilitoris]|uniref:Transcriptional regulator n=1 Tax=Deinococcus peraridilitoris (strain DSM 19664 / LMG 22246 / CIP 109416 / KR-200) TaxID=937777 RepID=L0A7L8_DEIPD|nr:IclR family transcriptional regulator [Deinococcus peraridilitoris]AFZ69444.1 transcriptional regulator [Deinococcus peraridilitoris DSM 19664]
MQKSTSTSENAYTIAALDSALRVLETIAEQPGLKLLQLAEKTQLTKSNVFRILRNLEARGYVWQDELHGMHLGSRSYLLGKRAESQWSLVRAAKQPMDDLNRVTQENVHLVVRDGLHSVVVDVRNSSHELRMYARIGRIGPLHAGGTPKVLLAFAEKSVVERVLALPLDQYTSATVRTPQELLAVLEQIRSQEYHVAMNDLDENSFSVAAPIKNHAGDVIAALSVAGPTMRFDEKKHTQYVTYVRQYAAKISADLGYSN